MISKKLSDVVRRRGYTILYLGVILVAVVCFVILLTRNVDDGWKLVLECLFNAALSAAVINLLIHFFNEKYQERKTSEMIRDALIPEECRPGEKPAVYSIYRKEQLEKILGNTIRAYTASDTLSEDYLKFIKGTCEYIKRDEDYSVNINSCPSDGKNHIFQSFRSTFLFRKEDRDKADIRILFLFKHDLVDGNVSRQLDNMLNFNYYAFREEIEDTDFVRKLRDLCIGNNFDKVAEELNLKISCLDENGEMVRLGNDVIRANSLKTLDSLGIEQPYAVEFCVPKGEVMTKYVITDYEKGDLGSYFPEERYMKTTVKIETSYPLPDNQNSFNLVYSRPTVKPRFSLSFEDVPGFSNSKVDFLPLLTFDCKEKNQADYVKVNGNNFSFSTEKTVFPRSGISFYWNFRKTLPKFEQGMVDAGLVDIRSVNSEIMVDLKYSSIDNFIGEDMYGGLDKAYLLPELAVMLSNAQKYLSEKKKGWSLLVYDAARPKSVQQYMFDWAKNRFKNPEFYVANPSECGWHIYGAAVDVTLMDEKGRPLDMGTSFDDFHELAHIDKEDELVKTGAITEEQKECRELLRDVMTTQGFDTIRTEWWHFQRYSRKELQQFKTLDF